MKRSEFLGLIFLSALVPALPASDKPVKTGKSNLKSNCRARKIVYHYPVLKLNKKDTEKNKSRSKSKKRGFSFPV